MSALESKNLAVQKNNQPCHGLKILMPGQMLSIFLITLAQLQAGNKSQKLKYYYIHYIAQKSYLKHSTVF